MPESAPILMDGDPAGDSLTGTIAGRFEIENRVGTGGMGEVYRAHDTRLKCAVALKRLSPALRNDSIYRRRLMEEAQRAAQMRGEPRVAAVYDFLQTDDEFFLIMEFVEGETLRHRLARPMQLLQFLHIARQCTDALIAANDRGVIHGDIKPENIMITPAGHVKILDFGVAKQVWRPDNDETIDRSGTVSGTPAYMAPEILQKKPADGRADIFSLGIVFYEVLTGHHPFRSDNAQATSDHICGAEPASARSFNRDVTPALESILQRMLAKDPAKRFSSASELRAELDHLQPNLTPTRLSHVLPPPSPPPRPPSPRKSFLLGVAAVLVVVLASWGVYAWINRPPVLKERGWALISDFESTGDDPIPDQSIREGLTIALQQSHYVNVFPRNRMFEALQRMKRPDVTRVDENLGRDICLREGLQVLLAGSVQHFGNAFQITVRGIDPVHGTLLFAEQEHFDRKEEMFDKMDTISRAVRRDLGESIKIIDITSKPLAKVTTASFDALQLYSQAKDYIDQGKEEQVEALLKEAIQLDPNFAMAHLQLGLFYSTGVSISKPVLTELQKAYDLRGEVSDREQRRIESNYFAAQEQYDKAVEALKLLVNLYPDDSEAHKELADGYHNIGRVDDAIVELREFTRLNPHSIDALGTLIVYLTVANHPQEAVDTYKKAAQRGIDSPEMHWGLGLAYLALDRIDDSRNEFHTLDSDQSVPPGLGRHYLAKIDMYQGQIGSALRMLDESINDDIAMRRKGFQLKARFFKGRLLLLVHQKRLAQQQAAQIFKAPETDLQSSDLQNAGILFARSGAISDSKSVLRRLEALNVSTPSKWNKSCLLNVQGEIALADGRVLVAISSFKEALAQSPQVVSHLGLARAYVALKEWGTAIVEWSEVIKARGELLQGEFPPDIVGANLELARVYRQVGNETLANEQYGIFLTSWKFTDQAALLRKVGEEMQRTTPPSMSREWM
jgi:serine/threonine protein kinase/tetratricopeptide (TPR) repeat protein